MNEHVRTYRDPGHSRTGNGDVRFFLKVLSALSVLRLITPILPFLLTLKIPLNPYPDVIFTLNYTLHCHPTAHNTHRAGTGTISTRAATPPLSVLPRLCDGRTNTATWLTTFTQPHKLNCTYSAGYCVKRITHTTCTTANFPAKLTSFTVNCSAIYGANHETRTTYSHNKNRLPMSPYSPQ